jgi:serine/threonine protein kinase
LSRQVTTAQLWESIRTAGLASADDCRKWAKGVTEALGKSVAADPELLLEALIKFGYLTPYQGKALFEDPTLPLMLEGIRIEKSLEDRLGKHWYEGRLFPGNAAPKPSGSAERLWVAALSIESMSTLLMQSWPPSMTWAEHHATVQAPRLDHWRNTGATLRHLFATVDPWTASPLTTALELAPLPVERAWRMVQDIATALEAIHQGGLVHGHLSLESILAESDGSFRLRRDPFFPPQSPYHGPISSLIPHSHSLLAVAAPELAAPDALPSVRSDLYALGCIWYRSTAGQWPIEPNNRASDEVWSNLHAKIPIHPPKHFSDIAGKCLLHLLAKDPSARFGSAKSFLKAMQSEPDQGRVEVSAPVTESTSDSTVVRESKGEYVVKGAEPSAQPPPKPSRPKAIAAPRTASPAPTTPASTKSENAATTKPAAINQVAEEASVEKVISDVLEKRVRVINLNPPRLQRPKPPIVTPVETTKGSNQAPTSAQSVVQNNPVKQVAEEENPPQPALAVADTKANDNRETRTNSSKNKPALKEKKGTGKPSAKPRGKSSAQRPKWVMPALIAGSCLLLFGLLAILRGTSPNVVTIDNTPTKSKSPELVQNGDAPKNASPVSPLPTDPRNEPFEIRDDDGRSPWAPPTTGTPYSTELLPMGIEGLVYISGKAWQHRGPIQPMVAWWNTIVSEPRPAWWPELAIPSDSIEQVAVAWYPGTQPGTARYAVRFGLQQPRKVSEILSNETWSPRSITGSSATAKGFIWIHKDSNDLGAMLCDGLSESADKTTKYVTFGPADLLETILASRETPFVMRAQLDQLRQVSDSSADVTILIAPSFLYGDGKAILGPQSQKLLELFRSVVNDKVQAVMFRAQWDQNWYLEWRSLGNDIQAAAKNASAIKSSIEAASNQIEAALVNQPADPYWRAIANRFPQMLRAFTKWMRTGAEEGQVVVNAYLPPEAISNLIIGSWMASQRDWNAVASAPGSKPAAPAKEIEEWLATPITIRIEQDSLENVLQAVATELKDASGSATDPLPMAIQGAAFQKDGITRNQQVRNFEFTNTPIRQVLTGLARRANPVTTVQAPNEKDQKVVWVILDDPTTPSKRKLEFTTRAWAQANNAPLPNEFLLPPN